MTHIRLHISRTRKLTVAQLKHFAGVLLVVTPLLLGGGCSAPSHQPATTPIQKPATVARTSDLGQDKLLLERLIAELQRSSRSFVYLRSQGFTQSDKEFEQLIAQNNTVLLPTRIVRRDEKGVRQIPGWPGVALTPTFKASSSVAPHKGK